MNFSYHSSKGYCPQCKGSGTADTAMDFWSDVRVPCELCGGRRYNSQALSVKIGSSNIADVLSMDFIQLRLFLENAGIKNKIFDIITATGLEYLSGNRTLDTLSTGELQRLKLVKGIAEATGKKPLYLLDEPTGGLHQSDTKKLLEFFATLLKNGGSILCVSHEPLIRNAAAKEIVLGPGGGKNGGKIIEIKERF